MVNNNRIAEGRQNERANMEAEQSIQQQVFEKLAEWESEQKSCRLITKVEDLRFRQTLSAVSRTYKTFGC